MNFYYEFNTHTVNPHAVKFQHYTLEQFFTNALPRSRSTGAVKPYNCESVCDEFQKMSWGRTEPTLPTYVYVPKNTCRLVKYN